MRTELYSLRSSAEELSYINDNLRPIVTALSKDANIKVLFKTEIDRNPKKIKTDLFESYESPNPPELQIFANALDTKDNTSFCSLFMPFIEAIEKEIVKADPIEYKKSKLMPFVKVHTLDNLPGDYPAYCFKVKRRKFLVLPRISLVGSELTEFICQAVAITREILLESQKDCPNGYLYLKKEGKKSINRFDLTIKENQEAPQPSPTANTLADIPEKMFEETFIAFPDEKTNKSGKKEQASLTDKDDVLYIAGDGTILDDNTQDDEKEALSGKEKFIGFLRRIFPVKGDEPKEIVRKSVLLLAILAFFIGAFLLFKFYVIDPARNNADITEIQNIFYSQTDTSSDENSENTDSNPSRNWAGLKKVNKEIVGWIKIDNTIIDYPVLWHKGDNQDNQYYIYRSYKNKPSEFGSIFVDYRCSEGVDSRHVILHGHNMGSDDSMFGSLLKYSMKDGWTQGNTDYYKNSPIVHFDTPEVQGDWIIFSVMKINASNDNKKIFNYLQTEFESDSQFMNFVYNIKMRSYLNVNIPINEDDRLLTLSTCSYESDNMRTIVVARKIREGEDIAKYVSQAKKTNPQSTVYSTFKQEYEANNITWYDGNAKLNDNGELEFIKPGKTFTVKFIDGNGKVFATQKVLKGKDAKAPLGTPPAKPSDGVYYYRFTGWSGSLKNITSDRTIKAKYEKVKIPTPIQTPQNPAEEDTKPTETTPATTPPVTTAPHIEVPTETTVPATPTATETIVADN